MTFATPQWLWGLVGVALLAAWLLRRRALPREVPFLPLWGTSPTKPRGQRNRRRPPWAVVFALIALVAAILGAAELTRGGAGAVVIIVDRGLTMSAMDHDVPRFAAAAERARGLVSPSARVELVDAFDGSSSESTGLAWVDSVKRMRRTAIDSTKGVNDLARHARTTGEAFVVLTDHKLDDGVRVVTPPNLLIGPAITVFAARDTPKPQAMITVRPAANGVLNVMLWQGPSKLTRVVQATAGVEANVFVDLPDGGGDSLQVTIDGLSGGSVSANAFLVRRGRAARIEIRASIPESLRRMIGVYAKLNPPSDGGESIVVGEDGGVPAILVAGGIGLPAGEVTVRKHPLTEVVDWNAVPGLSVASLGTDWVPLVNAGGHPVVAVKEGSPRKVWVAVDLDSWSRSPDFVVFWMNVFRWLLPEEKGWESEAVRVLSDAWKGTGLPDGVQPNAWPGIYRDGDKLLAMNAPEIDLAMLKAGLPLPEIHAGGDVRSVTVERALVLGAMGAGLACVVVWPRRSVV